MLADGILVSDVLPVTRPCEHPEYAEEYKPAEVQATIIAKVCTRFWECQYCQHRWQTLEVIGS